MSEKSSVTHSNRSNLVARVGEPESLIGRIKRTSYQTTMESLADDAAIMDTLKTAREEPESQGQADGCRNQPETIESTRFKNIDQAVLRDLVNTEVNR